MKNNIIKFQKPETFAENIVGRLNDSVKKGEVVSVAFTSVDKDGNLFSAYYYEEDVFKLLDAICDLQFGINFNLEK
jgi:hypothetical protein